MLNYFFQNVEANLGLMDFINAQFIHHPQVTVSACCMHSAPNPRTRTQHKQSPVLPAAASARLSVADGWQLTTQTCQRRYHGLHSSSRSGEAYPSFYGATTTSSVSARCCRLLNPDGDRSFAEKWEYIKKVRSIASLSCLYVFFSFQLRITDASLAKLYSYPIYTHFVPNYKSF